MVWTARSKAMKELSYEEALHIYDNFDFELGFPNYGKVNFRIFMHILAPCHCYQVYADGVIAGLLYFEPLNDESCKFHFAILRKDLVKNRGYIKIVKHILTTLLDKSQDVCYKCIYGYTPYKEVERFSRLFGFKVLRKANKDGITILIKE